HSDGNEAYYFPAGGEVMKVPSGASGPTTHNFDFSTATFEVTNPSADSTVPQVTSFTMTSPTTLTPGDTVDMDYEVTDDSGVVTRLVFNYTDPVG
ncbi:hypothetical protein QWJ41_21010, partial [Nocardioides sp. SOB44]